MGEMKSFTGNNKTIIKSAVIGVILLVSIVAFGFYNPNPQGKPVHVEQVFVDVDGDGEIDLLVSGEVIFNKPVNFQKAQSPP